MSNMPLSYKDSVKSISASDQFSEELKRVTKSIIKGKMTVMSKEENANLILATSNIIAEQGKFLGNNKDFSKESFPSTETENDYFKNILMLLGCSALQGIISESVAELSVK